MKIGNNTPNRVKTQNPKRYQSFYEGYNMLPAKFQPTVRKELSLAFGYPKGQAGRTAISRLINGNIMTDPTQRDKIEEIFKPYNINPWDGEYLVTEKTKSTA